MFFSAACSSPSHSNKLSRAQAVIAVEAEVAEAQNEGSHSGLRAKRESETLAAEEIDENSRGMCDCSATSSSVFSRPAKRAGRSDVFAPFH